jgi:hypothetical protein
MTIEDYFVCPICGTDEIAQSVEVGYVGMVLSKVRARGKSDRHTLRVETEDDARTADHVPSRITIVIDPSGVCVSAMHG